MGYSKKPGDKPKHIKGTLFESIISCDPPCKMKYVHTAVGDQNDIKEKKYLKDFFNVYQIKSFF